MAKSKDKKTPWQKLCDIVPPKKAYFVRWYCTEEEKRKDFDGYSKSFMAGVTIDTAMDWLYDEDVQKGIVFWKSLLHTHNLMNVYDKMYSNAMKGDVSAAKWLVDFGKSDYFTNKENELEKLLNGIDLGEEGEESAD